MRVVLLADVHSNLEALTACLEHARARGFDALAFVGDLVGYNADPEPVIDLVAEQAARGAIVVKGNHDAAAVEGPAPNMDPTAAEAIRWTGERLRDARRRFVERLPLVAQRDDATFVHASAASHEAWTYVTDAHRAEESLRAAGTRFVFCGHVHEPALFTSSAGRAPLRLHVAPGAPFTIAQRATALVIVGSAGQPRDGNTAACYALADLAAGSITFFRVPYDWREAARKVRESGLPSRLARRLEQGR